MYIPIRRLITGLIVSAPLVAASPAQAQWLPVSPLIDRTCTSGTPTKEGGVVAALMDADGTLSLVFPIPGERGTMFVVNFSDGTDVVFTNRANENVAFDLDERAVRAFQASNTLKLYSQRRGFIGSPVSLKGTSKIYADLRSCVGAAPSNEHTSVAGPSVSTLSAEGGGAEIVQASLGDCIEDKSYIATNISGTDTFTHAPFRCDIAIISKQEQPGTLEIQFTLRQSKTVDILGFAGTIFDKDTLEVKRIYLPGTAEPYPIDAGNQAMCKLFWQDDQITVKAIVCAGQIDLPGRRLVPMISFEAK